MDYHRVMNQVLSRLPFLIELFFNGTYLLLSSLKNTERVPDFIGVEEVSRVLDTMVWFAPLVIFFVVLVNFMNCRNGEEFFRRYLFSIVVFFPMVITWGDHQFSYLLSAAHLLSSVLSLYDSEQKPIKTERNLNRNILNRIKLKPAQLVLISFIVIILIGTFLLMLPVSSVEGVSISFVDALFMATSATCVTGLSTLSLNTDFTGLGQVIILILIQIGGLGYMTLFSSMSLLLGRSMGMKDRVVMQDLLDVSSLEELFATIVDIIKYTFFIELWGGIVLTIAFTFEGYDFGVATYYGFFHSISAFCNAGFSLFDNSLEGYATSPLINGTICILILLGGVGFIVLRQMREVVIGQRSVKRLSLHSRIVIISTITLTLASALIIFFGEFLGALDSYGLWDKVQVSVFQAITLRTAGFNTIPLNGLHTYTIYAMCIFMFIGASPGSTGGGIKTTTLAILLNSIKSTLKGEKSVTIFDRTIPPPLVVKATALTFISMIISSFFLLFMMKMEPNQNFLTLFFEVISAGGTVGLSLGITPFLSVPGKILISAMMLIGRIGPLTLVLAIGERKSKSGKFGYPDGRMMIG